MYYIVTRRYSITEIVIVKADGIFEAFENAGEDVQCLIRSESQGDYEVDYQSIKEVAYVTEATKKDLEK